MVNERAVPTPAPTDKPTFTIMVEDEELPRQYHIISIVVTKMVNKITRARIILLDGDPAGEDFKASNTDLFVPGRKVEIMAGYHSNESLIFSGIIVRHGIRIRQDKASTLTIECKHKAVKMSLGPKNTCYHDVTDSDVFDTIVGNYEIDGEIETTGVNHKELVQYYCTDWDFITSRAEVNGMLVYADDKKVEIKRPDFSEEADISLLYGATILELDAEMDAGSQVREVEGRTWDMANQDVISTEGEEPDVTEQGNVDSRTLAEAIGADSRKLQQAGQISEEELQAWTSAALLRSRMSKIQGRVKFTGHAAIKPGSFLGLAGLGERFNGKAFVSGIRHEIGDGSWTTEAHLGLSQEWFIERNRVNSLPASGLLPAVNGLQMGIVTQLQDDPDGEDRVLVKLPLVDSNDDGLWSRVATLDAGDNRGSFFRPEIGDEVVLGFLNDDPRNPVILGMFNSSAKPAPLTASDENNEKGFVSRSGIKLIFNDEKESIRIETPAGKTLTMDDNAGSVVIEDENSNKIEMGPEGITVVSNGDIAIKAGGNIDIEGTNSTVKASALLKAEGASGAELSTSATAVVKGAIVQIN